MGTYVYWKKWVLAGLILIGFNFFDNKALAQNKIQPNDQTTPDNTRILGRIFIDLDKVMYAIPAIGDEAFAKKIRDIIGKNGVLGTTISIDTAGYIKKFMIMENDAKRLGIDSAIQKKVEEAFRSVKWVPANRQNRIINDNEFAYLVKFLTN